MNPRVARVQANDDYTLVIKFSNGETRVFDMKPYLDKGVFQELKDLAYFIMVRPALGSIQWPHEQDLCPDTLYEDSIPRKSFADSEVEKAWQKEADLRWEEIKKGKTKCVPLSEVMKRARKRLRY